MRLILIIIAACCISGLQTACRNKTKAQNVQPLNSEYMQDLDSLLASYTTRPVYYADYGNTGCLFELRVNDILVDELTSPGSIGGTSSTINYALLRSGKQKVSVKLHPNPGATRIWANLYPTFEPFYLRIVYLDFKLPDDDQVEVHVFKMPELRLDPDKGGIPYYEFEGEFEAEVPYELTGWSDCVDLREIPDIEERVVAEYNRVRQMMVERRFDELKEYYMHRDNELSVALYESGQDNETGWNNFVNDISEGLPKEFHSIEDYTLEFGADGRSVCLKSTKKKGFPSALLWIKQEKGNPVYNFCYFELHLAIRKGTDKLVAIMC